MSDTALDAVIEYIREARGFDLAAYKPRMLGRRLQKRMEAVGAEDLTEYLDHLQVDPEELNLFFDTLLINVTSFFRDADTWAHVAAQIVPAILESKRPDEPVRVWSAGCATGEEAYTVAMVLAEAMGLDEYVRRVKIYGTDIDEPALRAARAASFPANRMEGVPDELRGRYFERVDGAWVVRKELRRRVVFGEHDLTADAPISRLDMISCRNVLMYFNAKVQGHVLDRFRFGLAPDGPLILGRAETLLSRESAFAPADLSNRVFRSGPVIPRGSVWAAAAQRDDDAVIDLSDSAFQSAPVAQVVIGAGGLVMAVNDPARALFGVGARDVGRRLQDLELAYRPVELRPLIERATVERRPTQLEGVSWSDPASEAPVALRVVVTPLTAREPEGLGGVSVTYIDETRQRALERELEDSNRHLETAYEELRSTNEELETTNEELQSTIEELETVNEEIQSTNEELETMNEELQSTNEEMHAVNEELRQSTLERDRVTAELQAILADLRAAIVVIDHEFIVRVWSGWSEELWGLRSDEVVGKNFLNLVIGLPVERLRDPVRRVLASGEEETLTLEAVNRRGRALAVRVRATAHSMGPGPGGAMIVMEEDGVGAV